MKFLISNMKTATTEVLKASSMRTVRRNIYMVKCIALSFFFIVTDPQKSSLQLSVDIEGKFFFF